MACWDVAHAGKRLPSLANRALGVVDDIAFLAPPETRNRAGHLLRGVSAGECEFGVRPIAVGLGKPSRRAPVLPRARDAATTLGGVQ